MHHFRNFKNFADASINLFRQVTVLIGKNGSGKTNAIEAVELLANLAHGRPLYEIFDIGRGTSIGFEVRGGLPACAREGQDEFELVMNGRLRLTKQSENKQFEYAVTICVRPEPGIRRERLIWDGRTIFSAERDTSSPRYILKVTFDNFAKGGNKPSFNSPQDRTVLSQYIEQTASYLEKKSMFKETHNLVTTLTKWMQASFAFDPSPKAMRGYERMGQKTLAKDGANISSVLHSLKNGDGAQQAALARIGALITQLPEEPFENFGFVETSQSDVLMGLLGSTSPSLMDARVLSDGTLRSLAVLTALETVPERSRLVIEEFDNGVHPSRVNLLASAVWECSKRRNLNTLITTHNPATLDSLDETQLQSAVLCFRDIGIGASRLQELATLPSADLLLTQGHLGDLITRKVLEKHLMPHFQHEQLQVAKSWLESLK